MEHGRTLRKLGILAVVFLGLIVEGCGNGDPAPTVGQDAPGTEGVAQMDSPEMKAKEAARNASRGAGTVSRPDRNR